MLKAPTNNTAGYVQLRSAGPREVPEIDFKYFDESNDDGTDVDSVVSGIEFVRKISRHNGAAARALIPGKDVQTREQLTQFVKDNAWGHHASCSNRLGRSDDQAAAVDSRFRVIGVRNLRVVDASAFPRIPGFFIVTAIYMIAEKASDVIRADAQ